MTLIDGHNLLFAFYDPAEHEFLKVQQQLEHEVTRWTSGKSARKYLLIFDGTGGRHEHGHEQQLTPSLRRIFSGSISADDWIVNWLAAHSGDNVELVTGDKRLYERVRSPQIHWIVPHQWKATMTKKVTRPGPGRSSGSPKKQFGSTSYWMEEFGFGEE